MDQDINMMSRIRFQRHQTIFPPSKRKPSTTSDRTHNQPIWKTTTSPNTLHSWTLQFCFHQKNYIWVYFPQLVLKVTNSPRFTQASNMSTKELHWPWLARWAEPVNITISRSSTTVFVLFFGVVIWNLGRLSPYPKWIGSLSSISSSNPIDTSLKHWPNLFVPKSFLLPHHFQSNWWNLLSSYLVPNFLS